MSTSLDVVFNLVEGIFDFVLLFVTIHGRKMRFFASSQFSISDDHSDVLFFNVLIFARAGVVFFRLIAQQWYSVVSNENKI